jgi:hypothetical protein
VMLRAAVKAAQVKRHSSYIDTLEKDTRC